MRPNWASFRLSPRLFLLVAIVALLAVCLVIVLVRSGLKPIDDLPSGVLLTGGGEREQDLAWEPYYDGHWKEGLWRVKVPFNMVAIGAVEKTQQPGKQVIGCWICGTEDSVGGGPILVHVDLVRSRKYTLDVKKATGMRYASCVAANLSGEVCVGGDGIGWFHEKSFSWTLFPVGSRGVPGPVTMLGFDPEGNLWAGGYLEPGDESNSNPSRGWLSLFNGRTWRTWTKGFRYPYRGRDREPLPPLRNIGFDQEGDPVIASDRGLICYDDRGVRFLEAGPGQSIPGSAGFQVPFALTSRIFYDNEFHPWVAGRFFPVGPDILSYGDRRITFHTPNHGYDTLNWIHEGLGRKWVVGSVCIYAYHASTDGESWMNGYINGGRWHGFLFDLDGKLYFTGRQSLFRFDYDKYGDEYLWSFEIEPVP